VFKGEGGSGEKQGLNRHRGGGGLGGGVVGGRNDKKGEEWDMIASELKRGEGEV